MKVLGFVNRFSRGVFRGKEELQENGNGEPKFSLNLVTAFLVVEHISSKALAAVSAENDERSAEKAFPSLLVMNVFEAICNNTRIKYAELQDNLGVGETSITKAIRWLKENGYINPERSKIKGVWQLTEPALFSTKIALL